MQAKRPPKEPRDERSFVEDERAIEGLPIRLVIALVVGVASLAIMMNMLTGLGDIGSTEATAEVEESVVEDDVTDLTISAIGEDGQPIDDATILITSGTATVENEPVSLETGSDSHQADLDLENDVDFNWRSQQTYGTIEIEIIPPSDSNFDDQGPPVELTVQES